MSLQKKSIANFIGGVVPAVASLLTVPVIVSRLGDVEYGLFTLVTAIVGYFALIDINVTAGSVKYLAEHHAKNEYEKVNKVVSFGGLIYLMIGLLGGLGIYFFADSLATSFFKVPANLHETARKTLQVASIAFFFGQMQVYLISIPQALQRYDLSSKIESIFGVLTSTCTVLVVIIGGGLVEIILVRLLLSVVNCVLLLKMIRRIMPLLKLVKPDRETVSKLTSFSLYAYFSRVSAMTHVTGDKLLLGALSSLQTVAFYSVPSLLVNRIFGLIHRLGSVIFPASSALAAENKEDDLRRIYIVSTRYYTFLNGALCLLLSIFSRELLHYWAGPIFGADAALVLVIIAATTFFDSLTNLPSLVSDGLGKPNYTSIQSATRTISCMLLGYFAIRQFGYIGMAWAYLITSSLFAIAFLIFVHGRSIPATLKDVYQKSYQPTLLPFIGLMATSVYISQHEVMALPVFFATAFIVVISMTVYGWYFVCLQEHKVPLISYLRKFLFISNGNNFE